VKHLLIWLLKAYRLVISPLYGNVCRYYPSCSAYALRAVEAHGAVKGSWLAARRLLRCHPWALGGYDPVPGTPEHAEELRLQDSQRESVGTGQRGDHPSSESGGALRSQLPKVEVSSD
jgi:putative membrane protein insertion efficiency factor